MAQTRHEPSSGRLGTARSMSPCSCERQRRRGHTRHFREDECDRCIEADCRRAPHPRDLADTLSMRTSTSHDVRRPQGCLVKNTVRLAPVSEQLPAQARPEHRQNGGTSMRDPVPATGRDPPGRPIVVAVATSPVPHQSDPDRPRWLDRPVWTVPAGGYRRHPSTGERRGRAWRHTLQR